MSEQFNFFAVSPLHIEDLLAEELWNLGALNVRSTVSGVFFSGILETAYRACLWSRIANRILHPISGFPASGYDDIYDAASKINWTDHLDPSASLAVDCTIRNSAIIHSRFAAQRLKDAIVDFFRRKSGRRPSVNLKIPDIRLHLHIDGDRADISLDLSGDSLHRRAYRMKAGPAPLKENIAAAILYRAKWAETAQTSAEFIDPMCGSGTLCIEAAMMASDIAPGLNRRRFGFLKWKKHNPEIWKDLISQARERQRLGLETMPPVSGYDKEAAAVDNARYNIKTAGLEDRILVAVKPVSDVRARKPGIPGLIVCNPPYGTRLSEPDELIRSYRSLGDALVQHFPDWHAAVLTGNVELGRQIPLRAVRKHTVYNGPIRCSLLHFIVTADYRYDSHKRRHPGNEHLGLVQKPPVECPGIEMFANRLRKNARHFGRWARKNRISCYRLYDSDLPEFAVSIDLYENTWVHIQELQSPRSIDPDKSKRRLEGIASVVPGILKIDSNDVFIKRRRIQKRYDRYQRLDSTGRFFRVRESGCTFLVNFTDRLDTGLFLDYRMVRRMIRDRSGNAAFLNLFCYTGTATVMAAAGGASRSISVDHSNTYVKWAGDNWILNGIDPARHEIVKADCLAWLVDHTGRYDLILLDPPTFSNRRGRPGLFDLQRSHVELILSAGALLKPEGLLLFSTNNRKFILDESSLKQFHIRDISISTIPPDFKRNPNIHRCWEISLRKHKPAKQT
ncbi:bifunctional 23S rRNA (guanine(2069)-N(7))-methyltransferase RlmK/23S rRNA (guanine(2445)-N(2))-methyltransferase RlmL [bacterium]|nr:bifunctional 23S rRNA (guanine(2069)-N(7))-methyltransferase RlmK/23S rRNA (guanine(2445)-N(2))-methyltransferase RlmL [candidate division CSSED10-310 bacterium]